jgi:hypothetical protein
MTSGYLILMAIATIDYDVVTKPLPHYKNFTTNMGRGGYETTDAGSEKSSAAAVALAMHSAEVAEAAVST